MSIHFSFASAVLLFQVARFHGDAFIIQQNLDNSAVHHYERTGTELRRIGEIRKSTCCNALALSTVLGGQEVSDRNNDYSSYPSLFSSITSAYLDSLSSSSDNNDDTASRVKVVGKDEARQTFTYEIRLPQFASSTVSKRHIGMCLREVSKGGRMSGYSFDLDTLLYISADEVRMRPSGSRTSTSRSNTVDGDRLGNVEIQQQIFENGRGYAEVDADLEGVLVSSISRDGEAYNAGVRVGDVLVATSATMGNGLWPKRTLEGVRSALSSRKIMSNISFVTLRFLRSMEHIAASEVVEAFELTLAKPVGINIEDTEDGKVVITKFAEHHTCEAETVLRLGDRIVAVDSSLGNQMWPVSNVAGVISAVTTRMPGQRIRFRFERAVNVGSWIGRVEPVTQVNSTELVDWPQGRKHLPRHLEHTESTNVDGVFPSLEGAIDGFRRLNDDMGRQRSVAAKRKSSAFQSTGSNTHKLLLARCRDVLRRYTTVSEDYQYRGGIARNAAVVAADRVLEALADASAPLDALTLNLIMTAYCKCRQPVKAITAFETAVGLASDGSSSFPSSKAVQGKRNLDGRIQADYASLNRYTATALLQSHALSGDLYAALRVLAAMEGRPVRINGKFAYPWPIKVGTDVRCYNVVLAAAANAGGQESIDVAVSLFDRMTDPLTAWKVGKEAQNMAPWKNLVTYNTMINAFAKEGRSRDAYTVFYSMKQAGVLPDKLSYTSLIKALVADDDVDGGRDLLREMRLAGIEADVRSYNTVIKGLCEKVRWYEAKMLVSEMESSGIHPNSLTYGLLLNGLLKAGKPSACLTLFEAASSDQRTTAVTENVQLYTTAISAASAMGDYERALELVSRMKKVGVRPNFKTLTSLMNACLSSGRSDLAMNVFQQMQLADEKIDGAALTLVLRAYCDNGDVQSASGLLTAQRDGYHEMSGKEVMASYNYLLEATLKRKEFKIARAAVSELIQSGYIPSKTTIKCILRGLALMNERHLGGTIAAGAYKKRPLLESIERSPSQEKFMFLLFVIDSLRKRNLPCETPLYASTLFEGGRLGGSSRYVALFLYKAKNLSSPEIGAAQVSDPESERVNEISWEVLGSKTTRELRNLEKSLKMQPLNVRMSSKETRLLFAAERSVTMDIRRTTDHRETLLNSPWEKSSIE